MTTSQSGVMATGHDAAVEDSPMATTTTDTTHDDLAIAFEYGKRAAALDCFVEEEVEPAYKRLEAVGYDGAWLVGTAAGLTSDEPRLEDLETLRVSNGYPGAADWLFYRVQMLESIDQRGREYSAERDRAKLNAFLAFDRFFAQRCSDLYRVLVIAASQSEDYYRDRRRVIEGRRYVDIEKEIFGAVAEITNAESVT